jgi:DNA-binding NarL/FixJ family response regulator
MSNNEIAQKLFISPKTASVHVSRILTKLGVNSRAKATAIAYEERLLTDAN